MIGLINPKKVIRWGNKGTRGRVILTYGSAMVIFFILFGVVIPSDKGKEEPTETRELTIVPLVSKKHIPEDNMIGVSYYQVIKGLSDFFSMKKTTPVKGQDRYMGMTEDNLALLEIIGNKTNISQATLMIAIPSDAPDAIVRNSALLLRFLINTVPEWETSSDWVSTALKRIADSPDDSQEIIKKNKRITMKPFKELGMVSITIKHKEETEQPRVAPKQPIDKHKNEKETKEAITRTDFPENKKIPPPTETPDFVPYDTPPEPVYITKPKYPESGKKAGIEGSVYLKLLLDSTGYVIDVKVVKSLNPAFDEAAVKAARTWRFTPAKQKGKSVRIWFGYSVRFILKRD